MILHLQLLYIIVLNPSSQLPLHCLQFIRDLQEDLFRHGYIVRTADKNMKILHCQNMYFVYNSSGYNLERGGYISGNVTVDDDCVRHVDANWIYTINNTFCKNDSITANSLKEESLSYAIRNFKSYISTNERERKSFYEEQFMKLLSEALLVHLSFTDEDLEADITLATNYNEEYCVYGSYILEDSTTFVIKSAAPLNKDVSLIKPFSIKVWICLIITIPILISVLYVGLNMKARRNQWKPPTLSNIFWNVIRVISRQDENIGRAIGHSLRFMLGCWLLTAMVLNLGYQAVLPSILISPGSEVIPQNFEELHRAVERNVYEISFSRDSSEFFDLIWKLVKMCANNLAGMDYDYFHPENRTNVLNECVDKEIHSENYANYTVFERKIIEQIAEVQDFLYNENVSDKMFDFQPEKVLNEKIAILASRFYLEPILIERGIEKFFLSSDLFVTRLYSIYIGNHVPPHYRHQIAKMVNLIQASGISQKIYQDILHDKRRMKKFEFHPSAFEKSILHIQHIWGVIYLLMLGYTLSFIVFIMEIVIYYLKTCFLFNI